MHTKLAATLLATSLLTACATVPDSPTPAPVAVQILALNDFHGNLEPHSSETTYSDGPETRQARLGGAARLGATLRELRGNASITVAAGDLIGASPLISSLFLDEPSIRALSVIGLELASVGNHEFDRGVAELRRMQQGGCEQHTLREPCAVEPFVGADFTYLAGNVVDDAGASVFPGTALREIGGASIGFIGMTLEGTPNLVSAEATAGYSFLDEAETANRLAAELMTQGADAVVVLLHQGGDVTPRFNTSGCPSLTGPIVEIVEQLDPSIALVVSGHTHQAYVCEAERSDGETILLTSAGRYGGFVTDIELVVDPVEGRVISRTATNVAVVERAGSHRAAAEIVARYAEAVAPMANRPVGPIADSGELGEDCGDRPAQDFVADAYVHAANAALGEPVHVGFANSGGVRSDLSGAEDGLLNYGELAAMAPFGNSMIVLEMTGAQIKTLLEQQFCDENPARICDSVLVPSAGSSFSADPTRPAGQRVSEVVIAGAPLDLARTYRVVTNSFLADGGDGFAQFAELPHAANVGFDIDALEAYVATGTVSVPVCGRVRGIPPAD
ncbi:bifunctional metallophosphatase/5'-nucleotidase [Aurantiacibacter sp. MUD11]|uniref:bifunctional metallophosphatase/5'-nucleotidase n=1 Tax=Aurantiacibacter sp. MUD11 TaxID=3003265 RepID=UPI0022AA71A4|nr:bifunctional metallophosphatase/5'-nucleotidase [Aurantiacibacter sp. MUD11]WAT17726.1 bifunctional metallophosphatase/5'-nucleotidase [Aurantiacibacter sp. MUD11]